MYCLKCGIQNKDDTKFCFQCGSQIRTGTVKARGLNMRKTDSVLRLIITLLIILSLAGCNFLAADSEAGMVKGTIFGAESRQPIPNAVIILCRITDEDVCNVQADLAATTDDSGTFNISNVPPGSYVVLYNSYGKAHLNLSSIDGVNINYKLGPPMSPDSMCTKEFFSTFGGNEAVAVNKGTTVEFKDGVMVSINGSFISEKYGVTMDFHEGKPLIIKVQKEQITETKIEAWGN